ncbi:MAG: riboflavin biosynthesis protein RibF [Actinobacteria bacterium]|nr:MAG: riboflavin biosynthesis protein RibF [Actinomycetota bacterium]
MNVARHPEELPTADRAVALGSFDGVHVGHRRVLETARAAGLRTTVVTFWPHPRIVLGNRVELLTTLDRRLELLAETGMDEALVVEFTSELARLDPREFAESLLDRIGARVIAVGENFRFGHGASGTPALLDELGFDVHQVPLLEGASSTRIRQLLQAGEVEGAAKLFGRPVEVEGVVVLGHQRGGTLGYPTANLDVSADVIVPAYGIYVGSALGHRAAVSIGVNPHYGGSERRIEPYLIDFEGDLYGERLIVELWQRLRDERAFGSEEELVAQMAADVEAARLAQRPV